MDNGLTLLYLPAAIGLGALHALEPGHAKTMIAAYLIGIKGTWRDAVLLGLSAATTHSAVVVAVAVTGLLIGGTLATEAATRWLAVASAAVVVAIGGWLTWRRLRGVHRHHHHAPEPAALAGRLLSGSIAIVDTPDGERLRLDSAAPPPAGSLLSVEISRPGGRIERLPLHPDSADPRRWWSAAAPEEPHDFTAGLLIAADSESERLGFALHEPDHAHDDDDAHARAHAADLPGYVADGDRPSRWQIVAFGAAGGLIPCPASISVMLLALAVGQVATGLILVGGFSVGLAITMVGVGIAAVIGWRHLGGTGRFAWISRHAPAISAALITLSGLAALVLALVAGPAAH